MDKVRKLNTNSFPYIVGWLGHIFYFGWRNNES